MASSVIYIVAKAPRPGAAKTRLAPVLTPEQAAMMAQAFFLDMLAIARRARGVTVRAVCRNLDEASFLRELGGRELEVLCQRQPGIGAALEESFRHGLADGFGKVAVLGGDSPTLPPHLVERAFAALDDHQVVIGPSEDGGYYLLGARSFHSQLFSDMAWSTNRVFEETLLRAKATGLRSAVLPRWYDVDTPAYLARLAQDLDGEDRGRAPHTRKVFDSVRSALARSTSE